MNLKLDVPSVQYRKPDSLNLVVVAAVMPFVRSTLHLQLSPATRMTKSISETP